MSDGLSRREWLVAALAAGAATGCAPLSMRLAGDRRPIGIPEPEDAPERRFLSRAGFGPRPGDVERLREMGREKWVDAQLRGDAEENPILVAQLMRLDVIRVKGMELRDVPGHEVLRQLQQAAVLRAVYGRNPLRERMVDFWTNHFNVYGRKNYGEYRKAGDDPTIRRHALGKFPTLLRENARSPAMLAYLDQPENRRGRPNENYARELMELHTLGVDGGYTQRDVQEVARCFTGWGIEDRFLRPRGTFRFDADQHDDGPKRVLGHDIPAGGGAKDAERVLDILAAHPNTARFLSRKLCRFFLGHEEGPWPERLATTYLRTGGDIGAMLRPLLLSRELSDGEPSLKRPFDFLVSALRVLGAETDAGRPLTDHLAKMGQAPFEWPMPDGYPDRATAWSGSLLARWNFALALTQGRIGGTNVAWDRLPKGEVDRVVLGRSLDVRADDVRAATLALCAPEFQWR